MNIIFFTIFLLCLLCTCNETKLLLLTLDFIHISLKKILFLFSTSLTKSKKFHIFISFVMLTYLRINDSLQSKICVL